MSEGILNIARLLECTRAEGPGLRCCIWVQGCLRNCPGCCNMAMQPLKPRLMLPVEEVVSRVRAAAAEHHVEGVTFLGGEPMLQAKGLSAVARAARRAGLTVMVFTGYTLEECCTSPLPGVKALLAETDVLVDGPYLADRPEPSRNWIGSSNQRFHYFTDAYGPGIETATDCRGIVEVRAEGGCLRMNGCPRTLPCDGVVRAALPTSVNAMRGRTSIAGSCGLGGVEDVSVRVPHKAGTEFNEDRI